MLQALAVPRTLDAVKAQEVAKVVKRLGQHASFRSVWREVARAGVLTQNRTLRVYLDLLVRGGVLGVRTRDVGSVYPQQLYRVKSMIPRVYVGLGVLQRHGLNWDVPETDIRVIPADFEGLVRSRPFDQGLMASLEDCVVDEMCRDARAKTGSTSFVVAMISTRRLDLPYLLRRADGKRVGRTFRSLFRRILAIVSSNKSDLDASVFLAVRARFLKIARQYSQSGFWKLIDDEAGAGSLGLRIVKGLGESDVVLAAAKQLGVIG
jgi:hypothetical protein